MYMQLVSIWSWLIYFLQLLAVLSVCLPVCLLVSLPACLFVCLSVRPSVCLSVCLSVCPCLSASVCLPLSASVCVSRCVSLSVCLSRILSFSLFLCLPLRVRITPNTLAFPTSVPQVLHRRVARQVPTMPPVQHFRWRRLYRPPLCRRRPNNLASTGLVDDEAAATAAAVAAAVVTAVVAAVAVPRHLCDILRGGTRLIERVQAS